MKVFIAVPFILCLRAYAAPMPSPCTDTTIDNLVSLGSAGCTMFGGRVLLSNVTFSSTASGGATPLNPSAFPLTFVPVPAGAYVSFFPEKLGPDGTVIPMIRALTNQYIDVTFGFRLSVLSTDQFLGNVIADRWGADTDVLQGV